MSDFVAPTSTPIATATTVLTPTETALQRLTSARTRLIMEFPFLGVLAMKLPLKAADPSWCTTVATDAKALYFSAAWIISLKEYEVRFAIAHEAMHCALAHFVRRKDRNKHRWNIACDFAVNSVLTEAGMARPVEALFDRKLSKLTAEEIYSLLDNDCLGSTLDVHLDDSSLNKDDIERPGNSDPELALKPEMPSFQIKESLVRQWRQRLAAAAQHTLRTSYASESTKRLINRLMRPKISWRELLSPYFMSMAFNDYSYDRVSRREGDAILPRLRSRSSNVHVVLDTSGSIKNSELTDFVTEINSMKSIAGMDVTLHACDMTLSKNGPLHYPSWQAMKIPEYLPGGGGTDFRPIFDLIYKNDIRLDLLIYFTDGAGPFPKQIPEFPVIWVIKGYRKPPWGIHVTLG